MSSNILKRISIFAVLGFLTLSASAQFSFAVQGTDPEAQKADGQSVTEPDNKSMGNGLNQCIAQKESNGNPRTVNSLGYLGKWQVGEAKLVDLGYAARKSGGYNNRNIIWTEKAHQAGIYSNDDFLNNEAFQDQVKSQIDSLNTSYLSGSAKSMVGQNLDCSGFTGGSASTPITMSMLIEGSQFGAGKVNSWASNGGTCVSGKNSSTNDGNDKCVTYMMCAAANCGANEIKKDMSKKTCDVTMPMIKAISCGNYTGQNLTLCLSAKPYLMTDGECASAEAMSQAAPKGPNKEKCENMTFGPGSGSWSFALACSYASEVVADQDGSANSTSNLPVSDPQCIQKLRGMGVEFQELGQVNNGTYGGTTCIIDSAVSMKGTALPFGGVNLTLNCDMAIAMETFSQKLKGLGITGYYGISSTRPCGPMRDKGGNKAGTITNHALGRAVDFSGILVGGRKVSMGKIWEPGTPDGQMASQVKSTACSTFRGVLSPTYKGYVGEYFHNHVEQAKGSFCR